MLAKISVDQALIKAKFHAKNNNIIEAKKLYESVLLAFPKNVRAKKGLASLNITKQLNVIKTPLQE